MKSLYSTAICLRSSDGFNFIPDIYFLVGMDQYSGCNM